MQFNLARCRQYVRQFDKAMESYEAAMESLLNLGIADCCDWKTSAIQDAIQLAEAMERPKQANTWKEIAESLAKVD